MGIIFIFTDYVFRVFTTDPQVINLGQGVLFVFILLQLPKAVNTSYSGGLRGAADLNWLMWLAVAAVILNEILGAYILSFSLGLGLTGLWLIQIFDEGGRLVLNI